MDQKIVFDPMCSNQFASPICPSLFESNCKFNILPQIDFELSITDVIHAIVPWLTTCKWEINYKDAQNCKQR